MKYKHIIYLLIALVTPMLAYAAGDMQAIFEKGNQQYAKGNYKEAMADYQQILQTGYQSVPVYFNMGNASFKNGDIPSAIYYYEKAHKLSPGDDDVNFNIQFANLRTTDKIDIAPEFFLLKWWKGFILMFSGTTLAVWSILFILLASVALITYMFTYSVTIKKASFYSTFILFVIGLFFIFVGNRQVNYFDTHHQAIIFSGAVTVKSGPANAAKSLFLIHEGTKVDVLENNNSWTKIRLPNGNEGWIVASDAKEI